MTLYRIATDAEYVIAAPCCAPIPDDWIVVEDDGDIEFIMVPVEPVDNEIECEVCYGGYIGTYGPLPACEGCNGSGRRMARIIIVKDTE